MEGQLCGGFGVVFGLNLNGGRGKWSVILVSVVWCHISVFMGWARFEGVHGQGVQFVRESQGQFHIF